MFERIKNKIDIDKLLFIFAVCGFLFYCLPKTLMHIPIFDEANAWNIVSYLNLSEIAQLTRYEGHTLIWYLILMPFAKLGFPYPYTQEIINFIFAFSAILVLWKFAPFNSWIKLFITFCSPMRVFSFYARCYAIGVLVIFLICSLYPKRLEHPLWYSGLLIVLANTSVMGAVIAFSFGVIFCIDLYYGRENNTLSGKDLKFSVGICLAGAVIFLAQLLNFHTPDYSKLDVIYEYMGYYFTLDNLPIILAHYFILGFFGYFFRKDIKPLIFLFLSNISLITIFMLIYCGDFWHYKFFYITVIIAFWLYLSQNTLELRKEKFYLVVFAILCFLLCVKDYDFFEGWDIAYRNYLIQNVETFRSKKIFTYISRNLSNTFPYLEKYNLQFYDRYGNSVKSLEAYKRLWRADSMDFAGIKNALGDDKEAFLVTPLARDGAIDESIEKQIKKQSMLKITPYMYVYPALIYKIEN